MTKIPWDMDHESMDMRAGHVEWQWLRQNMASYIIDRVLDKNSIEG